MANLTVSNISHILFHESSELAGLGFFLANISECLPFVILVSLGAVIGILGTIFYK